MTPELPVETLFRAPGREHGLGELAALEGRHPTTALLNAEPRSKAAVGGTPARCRARATAGLACKSASTWGAKGRRATPV